MGSGDFFIGIDGGSSRSVGVIVDRSGEVAARAVGGPANYHTTGLDALERNLFDLLERLADGAGTRLDEVTRFCFALAGLWREADRRAIGGALQRHGILDRATLISDVEALLATGKPDEPAIAVVAGTGSVVVARDAAGRLHKVGGNGHLLDDAGSGYDLGISGLRAALEAHDGRGPQTVLTRVLLEATGLAEVSDVVPWLYALADQKREVAQLAPHVVEAAEGGDSVARAIVDRAAGELARWCTIAAQALSLVDRPVEVLLAGGLLGHNAGYTRLLGECVAVELPRAQVGSPAREAAQGAALIALRGWERDEKQA